MKRSRLSSRPSALTPDGHPDKPAYLNNLGNSFQSRFERLGDIADLDEAITAQQQAVRLTPDGHPDKPAYLNNLGTSFHTRLRHQPDRCHFSSSHQYLLTICQVLIWPSIRPLYSSPHVGHSLLLRPFR